MSKVKLEVIEETSNEDIKTKKSVNEIVELNEKWKNNVYLYNKINDEHMNLKKKMFSIHEERHDKLKDTYDVLLSLTEHIIINKDNQIKNLLDKKK